MIQNEDRCFVQWNSYSIFSPIIAKNTTVYIEENDKEKMASERTSSNPAVFVVLQQLETKTYYVSVTLCLI